MREAGRKEAPLAACRKPNNFLHSPFLRQLAAEARGACIHAQNHLHMYIQEDKQIVTLPYTTIYPISIIPTHLSIFRLPGLCLEGAFSVSEVETVARLGGLLT